MDQATKVRENRLRRAADRQGLTLRRSRTRDPRALTYGVYWLLGRDGEPIAEYPDLDAVEQALTE